MKSIRLILMILLFAPLSSETALSARMFATTGIRYDVFTADEEDGAEFTLPLSISYEQQAWFVALETAYSHASVTRDEEGKGTLSTLTDMHLSAAYFFLQLPVGIRLGLDINAPTGQEQLTQTEAIAEAGEQSDLFEIDEFGEGLNIGANLGLMKEFGAVSMTLSGAYILNGEVDPTADIPDDQTDPGDQTLIMTTLDWQASPSANLQIFTGYSHFLKDQLNGRANFQEGDKWAFGAMMRVDRSPFHLAAGFQNMLQRKNKELVEDALETEPLNSNSNELFGTAEVGYDLSSRLSIRLLGDVRHYSESDRRDALTNLPFAGERNRYAVGPGATYAISPNWRVAGLVKLFRMDAQPNALEADDDVYDGINMSLDLTCAF